jgi:hypothetical protein
MMGIQIDKKERALIQGKMFVAKIIAMAMDLHHRREDLPLIDIFRSGRRSIDQVPIEACTTGGKSESKGADQVMTLFDQI